MGCKLNGSSRHYSCQDIKLQREEAIMPIVEKGFSKDPLGM